MRINLNKRVRDHNIPVDGLIDRILKEFEGVDGVVDISTVYSYDNQPNIPASHAAIYLPVAGHGTRYAGGCTYSIRSADNPDVTYFTPKFTAPGCAGASVGRMVATEPKAWFTCRHTHRPSPVVTRSAHQVFVNAWPGAGFVAYDSTKKTALETQDFDLWDVLWPDIKDLIAAALEAAKENARPLDTASLSDAMLAGARAQMETLVGTKQRHEQTIAYLQRELASNMRALREYNEQYVRLDARLSEDMTSVVEAKIKDVMSLQGSDMYTEISVNDDVLSAITTPVTAEDTPLGQFEVKLNLRTKDVSIVSLGASPIRGYFHPHVPDSGIPCWGNLSNTIPTLMNKDDYSSVLALTYNYLCAYNPADAYQRLEVFKGTQPRSCVVCGVRGRYVCPCGKQVCSNDALADLHGSVYCTPACYNKHGNGTPLNGEQTNALPMEVRLPENLRDAGNLQNNACVNCGAATPTARDCGAPQCTSRVCPECSYMDAGVTYCSHECREEHGTGDYCADCGDWVDTEDIQDGYCPHCHPDYVDEDE